MSEQLHGSKEHHGHRPEAVDASLEARQNLDRIHKQAEHEKGSAEHVEHLQTQVKERAVSGKEASLGEKESSPSPVGIHKELKSTAYKQTLKRIQARLHGPDKVLSRVVHQPTIEKLSNIGASTVARPSGILGGGFMTLLGSSVILYMARHYGFVYNFTAFFTLFIAGFILGLVLEGIIKLFRRRRSV